MIRDSLTILFLLTVILGFICLLYATGILRRRIVITTIENLPLGIFKGNNVQVQQETVKTSIQENSKSDENKLIECNNIADEEIVYWTPQGQHYHKTQNCRTLLRSKVINCGSINESGKLTGCHKCN